MLLAVDVGNTNVVFALFEGREIRARWRIATDPRRTGDEYAVWLLQLLASRASARGGDGDDRLDRGAARAAQPRGARREVLRARAADRGRGAAEWDFPIDVDEPRSLGADRAVNAIAAHAAHAAT
jgi:type III pantothenate kinase